MVRVLNNMDKDIVLNYLRRNNIETTFLIENVSAFGLENDKNKKTCGDYYGYFERGELKGILPFYNLGSCIPHYESTKAINEFAEIMINQKFETLLGMEYIINPFYMILNENKELMFYSQTSYYANKNFKPFNLEGVEFITGAELPIEITSNFIMKSFEDGFKSIKNKNQISQIFTEKSIENDFIFLLKNGEIKAQANVQTYTDKIDQVGGVYTLNSERGKGYCKAIVSELCKRIISKDKIPTLMVRKSNIPAVNAYRALGFTHYDNYLIINYKIA